MKYLKRRLKNILQIIVIAVCDGYQIYHNYVRPHMEFNGKTPAEDYRMDVKGDKWLIFFTNIIGGLEINNSLITMAMYFYS